MGKNDQASFQLYSSKRPDLPLVRRFVLVLVVVLDSLRAECWSTGVSAYCTFSELRPRSGLEVLSGLPFLEWLTQG
jgi:hypothetical protein